jgi:putative drug exporter of the RND superfamily
MPPDGGYTQKDKTLMSLTDVSAVELEQQPLEEQPEREVLRSRGVYRAGLAYGRFIYRFRWLVLVIWFLIVAASVFFMIQTIGLLGSGDNNASGSESEQVAVLLNNQFHQNSSQVLVALQSPSVLVSAQAYQQEITALETKLGALPSVQSVTVSPTGADGKTTLLVVDSHANVSLPISDLRQMLATTSGPARTYLTGGPAIDNELVNTSLQSVEHADLLALPIALLILVVVFGTFVAACLPLILALVAIPLTFALLYPIALHTSTSTYVLSVASIVGLGIAIDYSLFILRRFREELSLGLPVSEAIGWTLSTAGEAILFSGLIVMIGFIGLLLIGVNMTTSIGVGGALLVVSTVLAALTFLPALLCVLGLRINSLRVPYLWRATMVAESGKTGKQDQFWRAVALRVMNRPILTILLVCAVLIMLGWPIFSLRVGSTSVNSLPSSSEARQGLSVLAAQYPSFKDQTIDLVVETTDHSSPLTTRNLQKLVDLTNWLRSQPHVTGVTSLMQLPTSPSTPSLPQAQLIALYTSGSYQQNPALAQFVAQYAAGNMTYVAVSSDAATDSDVGNTQIDAFRQHASSVVSGFKVLVGGNQASDLDFDRLLFGHFPWTILFVLLTTLILLTIMFRSLLIPVKAVIMNVVSIGASYGILVFIFQWGNLSGILGFTSEGYVNNIIPIILFCVLFGLSMDYEVFLLSRIREEWLHTKDNRHAVVSGLEKTGSVITNAALLFIVVTVAFTFTSELETKAMGIGMTTAILVDATIIRSLLVPATMRLLGRWNWWFPERRKSAPVPLAKMALEEDNTPIERPLTP